MESSLRKRPLLQSNLPLFCVFVSILLLIHPWNTFAAKKQAPPPELLSYHNGPLLTGNITLAIIWYGDWNEAHKNYILKFIESLNNERNVSFEPSVARWWHKVESYQLVAANNKESKSTKMNMSTAPPAIQVKVVKQVNHDSTRILPPNSHVLSSSSYLDLVGQVAAGSPPNTVAVIFASKDVQVEGTCNGPCYIHGVRGGKQVYIVVGNPGEDCPRGRCTSPFTGAEDVNLPRMLVRPPHDDEDVDAKIVHFAAALAATVTNPYSNGFFGGPAGALTSTNYIKHHHHHAKQYLQGGGGGAGAGAGGEAGSACFGVFGSGSFPGYVGRIRIDPTSGAEFNAHGVDQTRFLLPAIWDPIHSTCWTTV